jgi:PQQ-like domain
MRAHALAAVALTSLIACTAATSDSHSTGSATHRSATHRSAAPGAEAHSAATAVTTADWPQYHYSRFRSGNYPTMPNPGTLRVAKSVTLDGAVYASPIVMLANTVVATENNTVYKFNAAYQVVWKAHLGSPSPAGQRPCGNIDPLGITGTPAYDPATKQVYVAAELSGSPPTHRLYAINYATGKVTWSRSLDLSGVNSAAMQERGAIAVVGSRVYVPFGGLAGDCSAYKGRVVGYATSGKGNPISYTVPTAREAGIWTPPGLTADYAGNLLAAVGNGASGVGDPYDHSDSVLELSTGLKLTDSFSPSTWATDNDADLDLGSQGPALSGPWIFAAGKSGTAYVLRRTHLGGIGGQVSKASICRSFGGTAVSGDTVYVPCTDGLRAVRIDSAGTMHVLWHAASNITGSPVLGGGRVWALDPSGGKLYSLDAATGVQKGSVTVGATTRFATPAIYGRDIRVPVNHGVVDVRTS